MSDLPLEDLSLEDLLFENPDCLLALINQEGRITRANRRLTTLLSHSKSDLIGGHAWKTLVNRRHSQSFRRFIFDNFEGTDRQKFADVSEIGPTATPISWTLSQGFRSRSGENMLLIFGKDLTEEYRLMSEATTFQGRFEAFMYSLPGIAFIKDKNRRLTYVSQMFRDVFECTLEEGVGRRDEDFLPRPVALRTKQIDERLLKFGGKEVSIEGDEAVSGGRKWMIHRFSMGSKSEPMIGGISLEITEFTNAEDRFRAAAKASSDLIMILRPERDERGKVVDLVIDFINQTNHPFSGEISTELEGCRLSTVLPVTFREGVLTKLLRTVETGIPLSEELSWLAHEGTIKHYSLSADRAGDFLAIDLRDITTEKLNQLALKESNADLEQFAYAASHDLLEPLRMVCTFLELLSAESGHLLDPLSAEYLGFALEGGTRMQALIRNLLDFSKAGKEELSLKSVNMNEVCEVISRDLQFALQGARATFQFADLPPVWGSQPELERLVLNLVSNSLKFRSDGACQISIVADVKDDFVQFGVIDNGIGIDPRFAERVFNVFQRLNHRESYEGNGIGLALCKKIVERHEGTIWVDTKVTAGSRVNFTLRGCHVA